MSEQQLARMARRRLAILRHAEEITGNVALTCRTPHHQPHPPNNRQPLQDIVEELDSGLLVELGIDA